MKCKKTVDDFIASAEFWRDELKRLRNILLSTELVEEVKWGAPCYTFNGKNVVGLAGFKSYFGLWFHQGALLADKRQVLMNAQEGTTRGLRQWRMHSASDIKPRVIGVYVNEAIQLVKDGKFIPPQPKNRTPMPRELALALQKNAVAGEAFSALRAAQRSEYAEFIASAKRQQTRDRRTEKVLPLIAAGKGLNDQYR